MTAIWKLCRWRRISRQVVAQDTNGVGFALVKSPSLINPPTKLNDGGSNDGGNNGGGGSGVRKTPDYGH